MAPIICPSCKSPAPVGAIFCDNCGFDLRAITAVSDEVNRPSGVQGSSLPNIVLCPNCGYENLSGSVFCENCGTQLPKQISEVKPAPAPVIRAVSPVRPPSPQPETPIGPTPRDAQNVVGEGVSPKPAIEGKTAIPGRLVIPGKNISIPLPPGNTTITIGREDPVSGIFPEVDLDPHGGHDAGVGRRHAQLSLQEGEVFIEDLDSVNGTAVNKQKLPPRSPHRIVNGDELRFGKLILVYMEQ